MVEVIEYCGLFLWLIYLFLFFIREIGRKNKYAKEYTKELIVKKPFHIIRIDSLFFLLVYLLYSNFADDRVLPYLYVIIVLTNIVYVGYDITDNYKNDKKKDRKDLIYYSGAIVLALIVFGYMLISKNLINTCILSLVLNMFVPLYVWAMKIILQKRA